MTSVMIPIQDIPTVVYGAPAKKVWLYVHGKCGCKEEAERLAQLVCPMGWQVLAMDLPEHGARRAARGTFTPWDVVPELQDLLRFARQRWERVALRATSLGAWFSLLAYAQEELDKALFVSPVLDMRQLILDMMGWAGVSPERLKAEGEIPTDFGQTLSWRYLQYAQAHPVERWTVPTSILYAGGDNLTGRATVEEFVRRFGCGLTVVEDGEHWFHTPAQLERLKQWELDHV